MPDFSLLAPPFIVDTDASATAIGGVLSQRQPDGTERPIAYASQALTKSQRNYEATKREMYALVHFVKYFRSHLLGKQFVARMDHRSWKNTISRLSTVRVQVTTQMHFPECHNPRRPTPTTPKKWTITW